ncbi:MAG TPA: PAS domain S-box protein [Gelria sp.]|nr:PAS domain S-box protein [Gelria sp.]
MEQVTNIAPTEIEALKHEIERLENIVAYYKQQEESAWRNWTTLRQIADYAPALIYILQGNYFVYVNSTFEDVTGYTLDECLNTEFWNFIHSDYRDITRSRNLDRLAGKHVPPYETKILTKNGTFYWGYLSSDLIYLDGQPAAIGIIQDISERKKAEDALLASETKFAKTFAASPNIMIISTFDGMFVDVNERFILETGYNRAEVIGKNVEEINLWVNPEDRRMMQKLILMNGSVRNLEVRIRTKLGQERIVLLSSEAIELDGQHCMINIMNDITEHKRMSNQIARLDQLNLIGEIAASIGHEMRNPMTSVRGFLQMFMSEKVLIPYHDYFGLMIEELDRANQIISEFLSLAKNKTITLETRNLKKIIEALSPLIAVDAIKQDKHLVLDLEDIPDLLLDEKEIRQLILNLVRNGLEAMPAGKTITIKTYAEENSVFLEVADEGSGIDPDIMDKIDTPFFTTKEQGTGLGLPVCHSIAIRHKATIEVKTGSKGTSFIVCFKV